MAFLRRNLPKMAVWDVEIFIGRNLSYVLQDPILYNTL